MWHQYTSWKLVNTGISDSIGAENTSSIFVMQRVIDFQLSVLVIVLIYTQLKFYCESYAFEL